MHQIMSAAGDSASHDAAKTVDDLPKAIASKAEPLLTGQTLHSLCVLRQRFFNIA